MNPYRRAYGLLVDDWPSAGGSVAMIPQRQRPDEALRASEAHLRSVLECVSESLAVIDGQGVIVMVNQSWRTFSRDNGLEPGKPAPRTGVGTNYLEVCASSARLGSDGGAQALAGIRAVLDGRLPGFSLEYACHTPAQARWFSMRATPLDCGGGGAVLAHVDITGCKQAEEALREQEAFFRLITENIDGFVAVLDVEGRRVYNSPSYARLLGERNLVGSSSFADVHADDRERVIQAFRELVASGVGQHLEYRFLTADGSVRLLESRSGVILDNEGRSRRVVVVSHDVTERRQSEERIQHLAFHDPLTQLSNRLTLNDRLSQTMATSQRTGCCGAVMFVDLDNFKPVNDRYGHEAGDLLLIEAARRLTSCVRQIDTVARFGGDEFVVVLTDLPAAKAESAVHAGKVAEKIREVLAKPYRLTLTQGMHAGKTIEHRCTASIGVALFVDHEASQNSLLTWADAAMYRAKAAGRNLIRFHDSSAN